jgi:membrane protein involved in colicin uptake
MFTKWKLAMLFAAPVMAGATTYAIAGGDGPPHERLIQKFDANGDGKLDDAERAQMKSAFAARRAERHQQALAKYDLDKDGKLDDAERLAMRDDKLAARFKAMDSNGDGQLTLDEFKAGAPKHGGFHRHGRHGHGKTRGGGMKP